FIHEALCEDMLPFTFQIRSMNHHSVNMLTSLETGQAGPPPELQITDYKGCEELLHKTIETLKAVTPEQLDTLVKKPRPVNGIFISPIENVTSFLTSFSLPNFYFHTTTAYNLLRQKGVPIGKRDYLGAVELNLG
ncbi:MAG: DUF1993 family protein, partial [Pseudomonadota bacterium]